MFLPRRAVRGPVALGLVLLAGLAGSCGGDGGGGGDGDTSWLYPFSLATDAAVVDLDGDGRADVVTIEQYATSQTSRVGRLAVYRQTAAGSFAAPDTYTVGVYPWRLRIADLDGDGRPDLLVGDVTGQTIDWLRQDPARPGHFAAPVAVVSGVHLESFAVGDLDGDGLADVAIAECQSGAARLWVAYQDPEAAPGTFGTPRAWSAPAPLCEIAVGDLDGDGRDDVVGWYYTRPMSTGNLVPSAALGVAWQLADGTLGPVALLAAHDGLNAVRIALADYLGDGRLQPIAYLTPATEGYAPAVLVALRDAGARTFSAEIVSSLGGLSGLDDAAFADFDGDGRMDAVVVGFFPVGSPSTVQARANWLRQAGDGTLRGNGATELPVAASVVALGDLDGDGRTDVVVFAGDTRVEVLIQSHTVRGQFGAPQPLR